MNDGSILEGVLDRWKASAGGLENSIPFCFFLARTAFSPGSHVCNEDISQVTLSREGGYASLHNRFHIFFSDQGAGLTTHRRVDYKRKLRLLLSGVFTKIMN